MPANFHILDGILPTDLDLPGKFKVFRRIQYEMTDFTLYGPHNNGTRRFMACGAPAGSGKSLSSHAIGHLSGMKYVILTATHALADQYTREGFDQCSFDIRGRSNYDCIEGEQAEEGTGIGRTCEEGADEYGCDSYGGPGCRYFDAVQEAKLARGIRTNYQYWIHARMNNRAALEMARQPVGMLILDEAHKAMEELARALACWIANDNLHRWSKDIRRLIGKRKGEEWGRVDKYWVAALREVEVGAQAAMAAIVVEHNGVEVVAKRESAEYRKLDRMLTGLQRVLLHAEDNNWLWKMTRNGISFECIWPGKYAERYLWSGVEKIVLMSATLVPKALHLLRIPATEYYFKEWPRQFPKELTPIWWVRTGRMGRKAGGEELAKAVDFGERWFREWGGLKGLVHTGSYKRAQWLQAESTWGRWMYINERGEQTKVAERFKKSQPPSVLVSPSYTTGIDLPDSECDWIWVPKLPWPDKSDPVMIARCEDDPEYYNYETMQTLQQECQRGSRHDKDRCMVVITDDAVGGFRKYARRHGSKWFEVREWVEGVTGPGEFPRRWKD